MFAGYLLTSASAIGNQLSVGTTAEGRRTTAYLVGVDPFSDLAVYRLAFETRATRPFETIATASALADPAWPDPPIGAERTISNGDPVSVAAFSDDRVEFATGTIIGTDRRATTPGGQPLVGLLDTTVRRPDRSAGSLLLTNDGEPIGIVVDTSSSLASAVPIDDAVMIADRLADRGWANATWIGFIGMDHDRGVEVVDVTADGPAAEGGLRPGDIIAFFDGAPIEDMGGVTAGLRRAEPGDVAILVVERDGQFVAVRVTASSYQTEAISEPIGG
jgi:putative serine protease PepD